MRVKAYRRGRQPVDPMSRGPKSAHTTPATTVLPIFMEMTWKEKSRAETLRRASIPRCVRDEDENHRASSTKAEPGMVDSPWVGVPNFGSAHLGARET